MTIIWNKVEEFAKHLEFKFQSSGEEFKGRHNEYNWYNKLYSSPAYRRAHIEIVDKRNDHGMYILHSTIFPHFNDPSPIWGFDIICGAKKVTGAFHDFSPAGDHRHEMIKWFFEKTNNLKWTKPRDLPDWAKTIFSPWMIAAGNINEISELETLLNFADQSVSYYLENVGKTQESLESFHMAQNRYCYYQKQNPQVTRSMIAMGEQESIIKNFVEEVLFPETW